MWLPWIVQIIFTFIQLNPTGQDELSPRKGDHIAPNGRIDNFYLKTAIYMALMSYFCLDLVTSDADYHTYTSYFIFLLIVLFGGLRLWCFYTLGQYHTFIVGARQNHRLIQTGPYKYLSHPSYTGQVGFLFLSLVFYQVNFYSLVLMTACILITVVQRIRIEETFFVNHFGPEYTEYLQKRNRLIPYIF